MKFFAGTLFGFIGFSVFLVSALTESKSSHKYIIETLDAIGPTKRRGYASTLFAFFTNLIMR